MAKFLFTMMLANDLGLPTRLVPIARALADRGHEVAVFNPAPAPAKLIAEAGLQNLPMPSRPMPASVIDLAQAGSAWDVEEFFAALYFDEESTRGETAVYVNVIRDYDPDVVVDSFGLLTCLAAHVLAVPLVTVLQGNIHPASDGFLWWKKDRPAGLPSAAAVINKVAAEYGIEPVERCADLMAGNLSLILGTPETDPLPASANVQYVGPIVWQREQARLPEWVDALSGDPPLVWVYSGNPRYANAPTPIDSIVVIRAAIEALGDMPVHVVLTTGYQGVPDEVGALPPNFTHAAYLPGLAMAERCDLMVHHGGHGSVMTGLQAGTPAVIVPTITERESNARRLVALGAGEIVIAGDPSGRREDDRCGRVRRCRKPGIERRSLPSLSEARIGIDAPIRRRESRRRPVSNNSPRASADSPSPYTARVHSRTLDKFAARLKSCPSQTNADHVFRKLPTA